MIGYFPGDIKLSVIDPWAFQLLCNIWPCYMPRYCMVYVI